MLVCAISAFSIFTLTANAQQTTHAIGSNIPGSIVADVPSVTSVDHTSSWTGAFTFVVNQDSVTSSLIDGSVGGFDFQYQIRLTALGGSVDPYLTNDGNFLTFYDDGNNVEFSTDRGVKVEFISLSNPNVEFVAINSFAMARTEADAAMDFTPNNGTNSGSTYGFERFTNGVDPIWDDQNNPTPKTPITQTIVDWTAGATDIDLYTVAGSPTVALRNLSYSFAVVPEPSSYALIFGSLAICGAMLRRRR